MDRVGAEVVVSLCPLPPSTSTSTSTSTLTLNLNLAFSTCARASPRATPTLTGGLTATPTHATSVASVALHRKASPQATTALYWVIGGLRSLACP